MFIWIIVGLIIFVLVFLSTRKVYVYDRKESYKNNKLVYVPKKLLVYNLIFLIVISFTPVLNLLFFIVWMIIIYCKIDLGQKTPNNKDAIYFINDKFNWMVFLYKFLNKTI